MDLAERRGLHVEGQRRIPLELDRVRFEEVFRLPRAGGATLMKGSGRVVRGSNNSAPRRLRVERPSKTVKGRSWPQRSYRDRGAS